jgi:hypothetical protein
MCYYLQILKTTSRRRMRGVRCITWPYVFDAILIPTNNFVDVIVVDDTQSTRISTHGPRHSRREEWRTSKGMTPRPSKVAMNRQGGVAARRKAGRSKRRR